MLEVLRRTPGVPDAHPDISFEAGEVRAEPIQIQVQNPRGQWLGGTLLGGFFLSLIALIALGRDNPARTLFGVLMAVCGLAFAFGVLIVPFIKRSGASASRPAPRASNDHSDSTLALRTERFAVAAGQSATPAAKETNMQWFGARKQAITAEYLGQSLADQIVKDVFHPQTAYDRIEWLLVKTFIATSVLPQTFGGIVADRALTALHHRAWSSALGTGSRYVSQGDLNGLNERASERYAEYNTALNTWLSQRNEKPLMVALATHVSPETGSDGMLEMFITFNANVKALQEVLNELKSKYEVMS
jgi:hypothetical protein